MIRKNSKKRAKQNREYLALRHDFLQYGKVCQVCMKISCSRKHGPNFQMEMATEIHHMKGRTGELLTDVRYFLAVCRHHHKKIEEEPEWAKENGFSISRLSTL